MAMRATTDVLPPLLDSLERALQEEAAGQEGAWADDVKACCRGLRDALAKHQVDAEAPRGALSTVDLTRPSLVRQVGDLRREHTEFADQLVTIEAKLTGVIEAFGASVKSPASADALPRPSPVGVVPDFGAIRQDGLRFVSAVRQHLQQETDLVLESVTTDLGAGD
jgi:hypothetical protein